MSSPWNPAQYERFANERTRPFLDLLAMVAPVPGGRVADLGCGTGELTRLLHERTGAAETVGIDSSESMLAKSGQFSGGGLRFELGDIATFSPSLPFDVGPTTVEAHHLSYCVCGGDGDSRDHKTVEQAEMLHWQARWCQAGAPTFQLTHSLAAALTMTQSDALTWGDFRLPHDAMLITLPSAKALL